MDTKTEPRSIVSVQLPQQTKAALERRAVLSYRSVSAEIRLAIARHLHEQKEQ